MSDTLKDVLPALYAPLLPELFDRPAIRETRATCNDCTMCDKGGTRGDLDLAFFRPDLKCCTYHPTMPNYLVGAILDDRSAELEEGRRRLREKIAARIGVTPEWIAAPRKYLVLLDAGREHGFGRSEALVCPYLDRAGGLCTIWKNREAVCATFFCKHDEGAIGHAFWTALKQYLNYVEATLARHAARSVCAEATEPEGPRRSLTVDDLADRPPRDDAYARYWRDWAGREEAFYIECHRRIRALSADDFGKLVHDARGTELLAAATARYEPAASPKLSEHLVLSRDMRALGVDGGVAVTTYSRYDSLFLSEALHGVLKELRPDETVKDAVARLQRDRGLDVPETLLLQMQQFGVIAPPPAGERSEK